MKLAKLVEELRELPNNVDIGVDVMLNTVWYYEDNYLYVNTEGELRDLFNGDGFTYSWAVKGRVDSDDGYSLFERCDTGFGYTISTILVSAEECINDET